MRANIRKFNNKFHLLIKQWSTLQAMGCDGLHSQRQGNKDPCAHTTHLTYPYLISGISQKIKYSLCGTQYQSRTAMRMAVCHWGKHTSKDFMKCFKSENTGGKCVKKRGRRLLKCEQGNSVFSSKIFTVNCSLHLKLHLIV